MDGTIPAGRILPVDGILALDGPAVTARGDGEPIERCDEKRIGEVSTP